MAQPPPIPQGYRPGQAKPNTVRSLAERIPALRSKRPPPLPSPILTPDELDRFRDLLVFARSTVEGYFSGKHKSPYRGSSAEFAEYREYSPGDDVSHLDWRVFGRSRRLFLRQYEEETDMVVYLLVDTSASMSYSGGKRQSKYVLAAKIAAALSYLMLRQGDKTSLTLFSDTINHFSPPGGTRTHLHNIVSELERVKPSATTGLAGSLAECASLFRKRGRLVILSDFFTEQGPLFDALAQFMHRRFEVLLLHVIDPDEMELPMVNAARFEDLETQERVQVEPEEIRTAYREAMRQFVDELAAEADRRQLRHTLVDSRRPYIEAIEAYLGFRGKASP